MADTEDEQVQLEAVLRFLREYGFSECESALIEDVKDKSQLDSSDLQKFVFPIGPQLPPVKIPVRDDGDLSSDDEFVSLGSSSSTELCSSGNFFPF